MSKSWGPCPSPVLPCNQPPPDTQDPPGSQPQRPQHSQSTDLQMTGASKDEAPQTVTVNGGQARARLTLNTERYMLERDPRVTQAAHGSQRDSRGTCCERPCTAEAEGQASTPGAPCVCTGVCVHVCAHTRASRPGMTTGHTHRHPQKLSPVSLSCASSRRILTPLRGRLCTRGTREARGQLTSPKPPTRDTRLRPRVRWLSVQRQFSRSGERTPHCTQGPFLSWRDGGSGQQAARCALTSGRGSVSGAGSHGSHESEERQAPPRLLRQDSMGRLCIWPSRGPHTCVCQEAFHI